jgi:hypothetical protein
MHNQQARTMTMMMRSRIPAHRNARSMIISRSFRPQILSSVDLPTCPAATGVEPKPLELSALEEAASDDVIEKYVDVISLEISSPVVICDVSDAVLPFVAEFMVDVALPDNRVDRITLVVVDVGIVDGDDVVGDDMVVVDSFVVVAVVGVESGAVVVATVVDNGDVVDNFVVVTVVVVGSVVDTVVAGGVVGNSVVIVDSVVVVPTVVVVAVVVAIEVGSVVAVVVGCSVVVITVVVVCVVASTVVVSSLPQRPAYRITSSIAISPKGCPISVPPRTPTNEITLSDGLELKPKKFFNVTFCCVQPYD